MIRFKKFLEKFPDLKIQVAHMGSYEHKEFFKLIDQRDKFPNIYLDTAMCFVDHDLFPQRYEDEDVEVLLDYQDRLIYGSDFPNFNYPYELSYEKLLSFNFPKLFYEHIFWKNAYRQ